MGVSQGIFFFWLKCYPAPFGFPHGYYLDPLGSSTLADNERELLSYQMKKVNACIMPSRYSLRLGLVFHLSIAPRQGPHLCACLRCSHVFLPSLKLKESRA